MNWLNIETNENETRFAPGEKVEGIVKWHLVRRLKSIELRLFWYAQGKGDHGRLMSTPRPQEGERKKKLGVTQ